MADFRFRRFARAVAGSDDPPLEAGAVPGMSYSPARYTTEIAERILQKLRTGRSLRDACKDDGIPSERTVRTWVTEDREGFAARYSHARKAGHQALADRQIEIVERVLCELMSGRTLRDICRDDGMPVPSTVMAWMTEHRARYDRARELGYEAMMDEILEIADDSRGDWKRNKAGTKLILDRENIARARLRINARRWLLAKTLPKIRATGADVMAPCSLRRGNG
jgi:hypothetical protein